MQRCVNRCVLKSQPKRPRRLVTVVACCVGDCVIGLLPVCHFPTKGVLTLSAVCSPGTLKVNEPWVGRLVSGFSAGKPMEVKGSVTPSTVAAIQNMVVNVSPERQCHGANAPYGFGLT